MVVFKFHLHKICHADLFETNLSQNIPFVNMYLQSNKFPSKSCMKIQTDFHNKYLDLALPNKPAVSLSVIHFCEINVISGVVGRGIWWTGCTS